MNKKPISVRFLSFMLAWLIVISSVFGSTPITLADTGYVKPAVGDTLSYIFLCFSSMITKC